MLCNALVPNSLPLCAICRLGRASANSKTWTYAQDLNHCVSVTEPLANFVSSHAKAI
jgi:hypothetical protein